MESNIYFQEEGRSFLVGRCIENLPNLRKSGLEWLCCHFLLVWWEASGQEGVVVGGAFILLLADILPWT